MRGLGAIVILLLVLIASCSTGDANYCETMMRHYYADAISALDSCDYPGALVSALDAKEMVAGTTDRVFAARVNSLLDSISAHGVAAGKGLELLGRQREYYLDQRAGIEDAASSRSAVTVIAVALLIATLYFGILFHRLRISNKEAEVESRMAALALIETERRRELENRQIENAALRSHVATLFADRYETISRLCDEYFENAGSDKLRVLICNRVENEINRLRSPKSLEAIEGAVNRYRDNVISKLRDQLPRLKPLDITFITLIYAGLSPRAVALFTGVSLKNFYTKRARLRDRIAASGAPDSKTFVSLL